MERRMGDGWGDGAERYMGAGIRGNGGEYEWRDGWGMDGMTGQRDICEQGYGGTEESMNGETDGGWMG